MKIANIASAYKRSPAQVLLSWAVQRGTSVVPKTVNEQRLVENTELFMLDSKDMDRINHLADIKGAIRFLDPRNHIGFNIFDEANDEPIAGGDQANAM